jgi:hypothetical protein
MINVVQSILEEFRKHPDHAGNEYKLRQSKSHEGNSMFAQRIANGFPTVKIGENSARTDEAVKRAFANVEYIRQWHTLCDALPANTVTIVDRWITRLLASGDELDLSAASCVVFAARSTCKIAPLIEQALGLVLACWRQTEKSGKPRIVPLVFSQSFEVWIMWYCVFINTDIELQTNGSSIAKGKRMDCVHANRSIVR